MYYNRKKNNDFEFGFLHGMGALGYPLGSLSVDESAVPKTCLGIKRQLDNTQVKQAALGAQIQAAQSALTACQGKPVATTKDGNVKKAKCAALQRKLDNLNKQAAMLPAQITNLQEKLSSCIANFQAHAASVTAKKDAAAAAKQAKQEALIAKKAEAHLQQLKKLCIRKKGTWDPAQNVCTFPVPVAAAPAPSPSPTPTPTPSPGSTPGTVTCPSGFQYDAASNQCKPVTSPISCPSGFAYDAATGQCVVFGQTPGLPYPSINCPAGYVQGPNGQCVVPIPAGDSGFQQLPPVYNLPGYPSGGVQYGGGGGGGSGGAFDILPLDVFGGGGGEGGDGGAGVIPAGQQMPSGFEAVPQSAAGPDFGPIDQFQASPAPAPGGAGGNECDPGFNGILPLTYSDEFGPMHVIAVYCGLPSGGSNSDAEALGAKPVSSVELTELEAMGV